MTVSGESLGSCATPVAGITLFRLAVTGLEMDFATVVEISNFIADWVIILGAVGLLTPQFRRWLKRALRSALTVEVPEE